MDEYIIYRGYYYFHNKEELLEFTDIDDEL